MSVVTVCFVRQNQTLDRAAEQLPSRVKPAGRGSVPDQCDRSPLLKMSYESGRASATDDAGHSADSAILVSANVPPEIHGPRRSPDAPLWRHGNFNLFWAAHTFDSLGDSFAMILMPLLVFQSTGSVAQMGLVTATLGIGNLAAGLVSGLIVDRLDRRRLLIACDIGRTVFYALIPCGWWLLGPSVWLIYVVAGIAAYLNTTFLICITTFIPSIVDQDQLVAANGRLQATSALAFVSGPMLAGLASDNLGPTLSVGVVAQTYLLSALFMAFVRARATSVPSTRQRSGMGELLTGLRFLIRHPVLRPVVLLLGTFLFFAEAIVDISVFRLKTGLNQSDDSVGFVFGLASLGAIVAGGLVAAIRARLGFGVSYLGGILIQGVAIGLLGFVSSVTVFAAMATLYTFGNTVMRVSTITLRQQITPDQLLGRVTSAFYIMYTVPGAVGAALAATLAQRAGAQFVLALMGMMCVGVAAIGLFTSAFSKRPEQATSLVPAPD